MPVKNSRKAAIANGLRWSGPSRKTFTGDVAMCGTPEHNPEPLPGSRRKGESYAQNKTMRKQNKDSHAPSRPAHKGPTKRPQGITHKEWVNEYMNPHAAIYKQGLKQMTRYQRTGGE